MYHQEFSYFKFIQWSNGFQVEEVTQDAIYDGKYFYRKAKGKYHPSEDKLFQDKQFQVQIPASRSRLDYGNAVRTKTRRLYEVYEQSIDIFKVNQHVATVDNLGQYPHFIAEIDMIDITYLRTLFLTQNITENGQYHYFIKREGVYCLEVIDDVIPVKGPKQLPYWGLSYYKPWQLVLMKAWLKEKGGIEGVNNSQPFEFLEAFGVPGYRLYSFKKELQFINRQMIDEETKKAKIDNIVLRKKEYQIIGKTKDVEQVQNLGLVRNRAAYFVTPILQNIQVNGRYDRIYLIKSSLPSRWVGSLTAIKPGDFNNLFPKVKEQMNLERQFLVTQKQLFDIFNKFYAAPQFKLFFEQNILQDVYEVPKPQHSNVYQLKVLTQGKFNINIEVPAVYRKNNPDNKIRYPMITYILARVNTNDEIKVNVSKIIMKNEEQAQDQKFIVTDKEKFQFWDGDYIPGYHKSCNRFFYAKRGQYYMYIKVTDTNHQHYPYNINLNTNSQINDQLEQIPMNSKQAKEFFDSTMYNYSRRFGVQIDMTKRKNNERIVFTESFLDIGYGSLSLITTKESSHKYAMKLYPKKLRQQGYELCRYYDDQLLDEDGNLKESITKVSNKGNPEIVVFKMTSKANTKFPPNGTVQFYRIKV